MEWNNRRFLFLICFFWSSWKVKANPGGICDQFLPSIYCYCESKHLGTSVTCYLTGNMTAQDNVWNSLADIEDVISLTMSSMPKVSLDYIPTVSLNRMKSLRTFEVAQATLGVLGPRAMSGLPELRKIKLDNNEITQLDSNSISDLPNLKSLSLSENFIQEVLAGSLMGLADLRELFLDRNNISRVENCAFCELHDLRILELWGNQITDLTEYMFRGLLYLERLDLYKNHIRILNDRVFHVMTHLKEIDLKDNLISHIAPNAFQGLERLERLMLNSNKIATLSDQVFKPLPSLRSLDLYNNELETLQVEVIQNFAKINDTHFSLSFKDNNPLRCDCRLDWVAKYLSTTKSHLFRSELQELRCISEDHNNTLVVVHELKMNCGKNNSPTKSQSSVTRSTTHPSNIIPHEIQGRKGKTRTTPLVVEEELLAQDSESKEIVAEELEVGDNASSAVTCDACFILFTLWTLFLVTERQRTMV